MRSEPQITPACVDYARHVCWIETIVVDGDDVPDAESGKVFVDERACTTHSDDGYLFGREQGLTSVAEQPYLAVILWHSVSRVTG